MAFLDKIKDIFSDYQDATHFWVAYSGGSDSQVLLHLLCELRNKGLLTIPFSAIHINHQLQTDATKWAQCCAQQCLEWSVAYQQVDLQISLKPKESLEEVAREERYRAFTSFMQTNHYLLTAHHAEDQAETVLLQLFRGAGPKGLAAMPEKISFAKGTHARPLLSISRDLLRQYSSEHHLEWIEDPSNNDSRFTRNFLRNEIVPLLKQRWPTISETLSRSAKHCASSQAIIEEVAENDLASIKDESAANTLSIALLQTLSLPRQQQVLRKWFETLNLPAPATIHLQRIFDEVINARWDATPIVTWEGAEIRRFDGNLYAMSPLTPFDTTQRIFIENLNNKRVEVRFRQGGEAFKLAGRKHRVLLKNWFQENKIPPWLRDRVPLLFIEGEMLGVLSEKVLF
jgi:tRNA(Ile)-lysidine synthase